MQSEGRKATLIPLKIKSRLVGGLLGTFFVFRCRGFT